MFRTFLSPFCASFRLRPPRARVWDVSRDGASASAAARSRILLRGSEHRRVGGATRAAQPYEPSARPLRVAREVPVLEERFDARLGRKRPVQTAVEPLQCTIQCNHAMRHTVPPCSAPCSAPWNAPCRMFYTMPKLSHHAGDECRASLARFYECALPPSGEGDVLDLCSSFTSHFPEGWRARPG